MKKEQKDQLHQLQRANWFNQEYSQRIYPMMTMMMQKARKVLEISELVINKSE